MHTELPKNTAIHRGADLKSAVTVAAVQISPVFHNKAETTKKVCDFILEAGKHNARVIGFPECCIPGYPGWGQFHVTESAAAYTMLTQQFHESVEVPGPETDQIGAACREANIYAVVGVNERIPNTTGTMYNTQLIFGSDGTLLNKHQKYVATVTERLVHGPGKTSTHCSVKTEFGCLSGLVCGENANPLAMYSCSLEYPSVHVASWPAPFAPGSDTAVSILSCTRSFAYSLGCYVINSVSIDDDPTIEAYQRDEESRQWLVSERHKLGATIIGPDV
ncbi:nitrilase/cyanide hydratase and apolipo protein N-acyltransferase [Dactylonectria macrodidyma]|uniref:Nitrilase/cyanide hydratase and apolipo protein N-acyltransferase n=1 Tax=Dactylonectria macrodidyma TaxID=307937 RepID=A0A9P9ESL8_9HYPO|nr:nitrilase/cyanide hydratase and apolipo protein N-acyltransferase [Dactylonectria macrodidyma]